MLNFQLRQMQLKIPHQGKFELNFYTVGYNINYKNS